MTKPLKLAVFISGRGSNMVSLIDATKEENFPAQIDCVISNKEDAPGLEKARQHNIPTHVIPHKDYERKSDFEQVILETLAGYDINLICLAGFMRVLSPYFLGNWPGEIINIHPSLLPKYKGLDTHRRALEAGDKKSGCSVHHVTAGVDEGEIILQRSVDIDISDTEEKLAAKVLKQEHIAYPEAIKILAQEKA